MTLTHIIGLKLKKMRSNKSLWGYLVWVAADHAAWVFGECGKWFRRVSIFKGLFPGARYICIPSLARLNLLRPAQVAFCLHFTGTLAFARKPVALSP